MNLVIPANPVRLLFRLHPYAFWASIRPLKSHSGAHGCWSSWRRGYVPPADVLRPLFRTQSEYTAPELIEALAKRIVWLKANEYKRSPEPPSPRDRKLATARIAHACALKTLKVRKANGQTYYQYNT